MAAIPTPNGDSGHRSRAFDALVARCKKRNFAFRWEVGEAIATAANRAYIPMMLDTVKQGADWRVQEVSVVALALMHDAVGINPLLQSVRSDDRYVRRIACWQLDDPSDGGREDLASSSLLSGRLPCRSPEGGRASPSSREPAT